MKKFRTLMIASEFYHSLSTLKVRGDARNQLQRAARSIALNLAEARGRRTTKDQVQFFHVALGSLRECQAVLMLEQLEETTQWNIADNLGAHIYRLIQNAK